jgi:hypothetical protein
MNASQRSIPRRGDLEDLLDLQIPITFYVDEKPAEMYVDDIPNLADYECVMESAEGHQVTKHIFNAVVDPMQFKGGMFYGGEDDYVPGVMKPTEEDWENEEIITFNSPFSGIQ